MEESKIKKNHFVLTFFQILLLLSLVMTIVNLINLIILEVGEWRGFLSPDDKEYIRENGLEDLMHAGWKLSSLL